jgi:hypothetical protein
MARSRTILGAIAALGVDRVRLSVIWANVAPRSKSAHRPSFDAADPSAYPPGAWHPYDTVIRLARDRGLGVDLNLTAPIPFWAARTAAPAPGFKKTYSPSPAAFGEFVRAVARRYAGDYLPGGTPRRGPPGTASATASGRCRSCGRCIA